MPFFRTILPARDLVSLGLLMAVAFVSRAAQGPAQPPPDPQAAVRDQLKVPIESFDRKIEQAEALATDEQATRIGVPVQDLHDYALRLRETRSVFEDHLDAIDAFEEVQRTIAGVNGEIESYKGLPDPPPFAPWIVDTYRDALDARTTQREIARRGLDQAKELAATASKDLKTRDGDFAVANEKLVNNADEGQRATLEWSVQVAVALRDLAQARNASAEFIVKLSEARVDQSDKELDLADRKRKEAESKIKYRKEDLESKRAELIAARDALEKDRAAADVQREKTKKRLEDARAALEKSVEDEEYAVNQAGVELRKVEAEAAQEKAFLLRGQMDTLHHLTEIWSARYSLQTAPKEFPLRQQREQLKDYLNSLGVSRREQETREDVLRTEVRELGQRLAQMQQGVNSLDNTQPLLKLRTGQLDQFAQSLASVERAEKLIQRVLTEIAEVEQRQSLGERLQQIGETAQMIWDKELFKIDEQPLTPRKIGIALIILAVGLALTRVVRGLLRRALHARPHIDPNASATVERLVHYSMIVAVVLFALNTVNIPLTVFTFFGGALAIGVGFGAQNLINNFISGLILMAERPIKIGDIVEIDGQRGRIAEIGARCSRLSLFTGIDILVPNSSFLEKNVINWTHADTKIRTSLSVGVAYGSNTREVTRLLVKALDDHGKVLKHPEPVVLFTDFGDNALVFESQFWIDVRLEVDGRAVCSDLRHMIERSFREAGIVIAYPQRDIHLDTTKPFEVRMVPADPGADASADIEPEVADPDS